MASASEPASRPLGGAADSSGGSSPLSSLVGHRSGDLRFVELVGHGAAGTVYRVARGAETLAAKVFADPTLWRREERMLRLAAPTCSPSFRGRGFVADAAGGEHPYLLLDWASGSPLGGARPSDASARVRRAWCIMHAVATALSELHALAIRHGDVKPDNVLWDGERATLIDLGLAHVGGELVGYTPAYAAPELVAYPGSLAADLFALGKTVLAELEPGDPGLALFDLLRAMTATAPGARPSAALVASRARAALGLAADPAEHRERVRRAYVAVRGDQLQAAFSLPDDADGAVMEWLAPLAEAPAPALAPLTAWQKLRWVERVTGRAVTTLPAPFRDDARLAEALLSGWPERHTTSAAAASWVDAALALDSHLDAIEAAGAAAPWPLRRSAASRLVTRGELARAELEVATWPDDVDARLVRAEIFRRTGRGSEAAALLTALEDDPRARPLCARLAWDRGDTPRAEVLAGDSNDARACEVRVLCRLARGQHALGVSLADDALPWAHGLERARLLGVRALCKHAMGDGEAAFVDFAEAQRLAVEQDAALEHASFATGAAAAAADAGLLAEALDAATAASLAWERAAQPARAARALLTRATVLMVLGARFEALEAARAAHDAAVVGGDEVARDYASVACLEAEGLGRASLRERAERLATRAEAHAPEVRARILARLLAWDLVPESERIAWDARISTLPAPAQWDWIGHRLGHGAGEQLEALLEAAAALPVAAAAADVRLQTWSNAARAVGDERAPPWLAKRRELIGQLRSHVPREHLASFDERWELVSASPEAAARFEPEQWLQIERLTRLLHGGSSVAAVGAQVLDALLLWTGAERGLLLVNGAEGLEPKVARNVDREDLSMEQLALSRSLAERALATGDVVRTHVDEHAGGAAVARSIHALRLRSILVIPLLVRGVPQGVLYLDDRSRGAAFRHLDLAWVRALAAQAAHALDAAEERRRLEKALRRAERAEAALSRRVSEQGSELTALRETLGKDPETSALRGHSAAMARLRHAVARVASAQLPVLVRGESGTGKELVARALHAESDRKAQPFVSENCAALPETLLESTLFGHVRGAFTGATGARTGLFEMAHRGTLFLDEIGEMSLSMQAKLLRVLETGEFYPVGSEKQKRVDVRVVAATHRDLEALVRQGTFRQDLLFRLAVVELRVPALRERAEDIPLLAAHFLAKYQAPDSLRLAPAAMARLMAYAWPGNVRQLENELRKLIVFANGIVEVVDLSPAIQGDAVVESEPTESEPGAAGSLKGRLDALEVELVEGALRSTGWNRSRAAEMLGVSRFGLQKMIRRLGLRPPN